MYCLEVSLKEHEVSLRKEKSDNGRVVTMEPIRLEKPFRVSSPTVNLALPRPA